jgi:hypothetical protein
MADKNVCPTKNLADKNVCPSKNAVGGFRRIVRKVTQRAFPEQTEIVEPCGFSFFASCFFRKFSDNKMI